MPTAEPGLASKLFVMSQITIAGPPSLNQIFIEQTEYLRFSAAKSEKNNQDARTWFHAAKLKRSTEETNILDWGDYDAPSPLKRAGYSLVFVGCFKNKQKVETKGSKEATKGSI